MRCCSGAGKARDNHVVHAEFCCSAGGGNGGLSGSIAAALQALTAKNSEGGAHKSRLVLIQKFWFKDVAVNFISAPAGWRIRVTAVLVALAATSLVVAAVAQLMHGSLAWFGTLAKSEQVVVQLSLYGLTLLFSMLAGWNHWRRRRRGRREGNGA